ncbi:MarR family transcriptional regulator (plasmid) [Rhizobium grahamii]|uniref:MarR family transcriptional regulator n=1 Tax=Rhizobium grahamii TaxID=1120045 RepID=A0A5Q0CCJ7_9HYPH|nr:MULTISPECIES: MarR family transcriptional regulator [Rhizobium]QFY63133.1 MarR family transcriptional regulator [Rhizobium grahamii]QRM52105.1 MarR family transcriptional regulator [Rhizobium sp. BG6]
MQSPSDLPKHTGYWMRMVSNAVSHDFARKIAAEDVTVAEWVFMRALYDEEALPPSALAAKMGMTKGAISKLADRLVSKGLIARAEHETDRRAHSLFLTSAGREKVPRLASLADLNETEYFGLLTEKEHAALDQILKALVERRGLETIPID